MKRVAKISCGCVPASGNHFERFTKRSPRLGSKARSNEVNQRLVGYAKECQRKWRNRGIVPSMDLHPGSSITRIAVDYCLSILRKKSIEINHRLDPTFDTWKHP